MRLKHIPSVVEFITLITKVFPTRDVIPPGGIAHTNTPRMAKNLNTKL